MSKILVVVPEEIEVWFDGGTVVVPGLILDGEPHIAVRRLALAMDWPAARYLGDTGKVFVWTSMRR